MIASPRQTQLLKIDRWQPLRRFIEPWYARPLSSDDGNSPEQIQQAEQRIGARFPPVLVEWFELVGNRLHNVQDMPVRLDNIELTEGAVDVWIENQAVWIIRSPISGEDPVCFLNDAENFLPWRKTLSQTLLSMLISDTLVGAWAGKRIGPLGELAASVRGGYCNSTLHNQQRLPEMYDTLPFANNPFFEERYLGDEATVIRIEPATIEWMTATDEAFAALDEVFDLDPEGNEREVVFAFEGVSEWQFRSLSNTAKYQSLIRGVGHLGCASLCQAKAQLIWYITTAEPERVISCLTAVLSDDVKQYLTIAMRPVSICVYDVVYPEGKTAFVLPE